jgi:hypothetical protein
MKRNFYFVASVLLSSLVASAAFATPTSIIWNPSVDVQAPKTTHLGFDTYFTPDGENFYTNDAGLTWGLGSGVEVGLDYISPLPKGNVQFNAKWGMPEKGSAPAFAVGAQFFGDKDVAPNIFYALLAKTFGTSGRFHLGAYTGNNDVLADESGVIIAWDKTFNAKWWGAVDYASGDGYGVLSFGGAYKFAPNVGVLLGYVIPNISGARNQITTQVDIDF